MTIKTKDPITAREMAVRILLRIINEQAYANLALDQGMKHCRLSDQDKGLVTELVNGTIRMKKHLDWVLDQFLTKKQQRLKSRIYVILISSLYQLLFLERIPAYAIINEAVEMSRWDGKGMSGLVNGLLRNVNRNKDGIKYPEPSEDPVSYLAVYYSHPEWLVKRWLEHFGFEGTCRLLEFNNQPPSLTVRANRLKIQTSELKKILEEEGVTVCKGRVSKTSLVLENLPVPLFCLESYQQGLFYIQNESAMLIPLVLNPQPNTLVYDFCCGVGGKTTHLAEMMDNLGKIMGFDLYGHKLKLLKVNCERMGINIVASREGDVFDSVIGLEKADAVLLDAPCSGSGVLRSRADLRWRKNKEDIAIMSGLQGKMLDQVAETVRPGGRLVYSTCSLEPEENQEVVEGFIKGHTDFEILDFNESGRVDPWISKGGTEPYLTVFPPRHQLDGMFISLMRRR